MVEINLARQYRRHPYLRCMGPEEENALGTQGNSTCNKTTIDNSNQLDISVFL
jgi:hypothetical protein